MRQRDRVQSVSEENAEGRGWGVVCSATGAFTITIVCCLLSELQVVNLHLIPTSGQPVGPHNYVFGDSNKHTACHGSGIIQYTGNRLYYCIPRVPT